MPTIIKGGITRLNEFVNKIAMYRLVLYVLIFYAIVAFCLSFFSSFGLIPFSPLQMLFSLSLILGMSWLTNKIFSFVFEAPTNVESVYITGLILFFVITPPTVGNYTAYFTLAVWASLWAMASKYIFAIGKKHMFNPVAIALVITSLTMHQAASWWIGRGDMLSFVVLGGVLIVIKIRRFDLFWSFIITGLTAISLNAVLQSRDLLYALSTTFSDTAFLFFAFIMLTEPLTSPPTKKLRIAYGILVGFLFAPNLHFGSWYSTPEFALVIGNIFSYIVSQKGKYFLILKERIEVAKNTFEYIFESDTFIPFLPGQYMEWTLPHPNPDARGNRRYFTIASSPTETNVHIALRQYEKSSSYKNKLKEMDIGSTIITSQLTGDFVLPKNKEEKLVFIAGGIGVTPFRSMLQFLLDKNEKRDIVVLYVNRSEEDVAYKDIFEKARIKFGTKIVYFYSDNGSKIDTNAIQNSVPDYMERNFLISGPSAMVSGCKSVLKGMGLQSKNIKTDYFPGL